MIRSKSNKKTTQLYLNMIESRSKEYDMIDDKKSMTGSKSKANYITIPKYD